MIDVTVPDAVSISALNALEYCPRLFYYQFVQGERMVNDCLLEGTLDHRRVHQEGMKTSADGEIETTRLYLYSETLRLSGFTDVVEEHDGQLIPVEYKHGKQGQWLNDAIQLCAQALCLEERRPDAAPISYGYIFYVSSRRRVQINFTEELRERTRAAIAQAFEVAALATPPPPLTGKLTARCPHCSLLPLCLPDEVNLLQSR
jgi:CRISPR-associated exonuclease Cas4